MKARTGGTRDNICDHGLCGSWKVKVIFEKKKSAGEEHIGLSPTTQMMGEVGGERGGGAEE